MFLNLNLASLNQSFRLYLYQNANLESAFVLKEGIEMEVNNKLLNKTLYS